MPTYSDADIHNIPDELQNRPQWLLFDTSSDAPRRPHWAGDFSISWNDPDDWHSFDDALQTARQQPSWGIGYVFAYSNPDYPRGLYGCLDLDGCYANDGSFADWVPDLDQIADAGYIERSPSTEGLHVPVVGFEPPEWWSDCHLSDDEHEGVEAYGSKFVTFTGDKLAPAGDEVAEIDLTGWLASAFENITGAAPRTAGGHSNHDRDVDVDLDVHDVVSRAQYRPGENHAHPFHPSGTGTNFRVDDGARTFRCWRHSVTGNALHLVGIEQGVIECGDWERGLTSETWADIFDAARDAGYDIPEPDDGDDSPDAPPDDAGADAQWAYVHDMYSAHNDDADKREGRQCATQLVDDEHYWANHKGRDLLFDYDPETGVYGEHGNSRLREVLAEALGAHYSTHEHNEIKNTLKAWNTHTEDEFGGLPGKVTVANGVLNIADRELEDYDPDALFTNSLPVSFDPDAECPMWHDFLDDATGTDTDRKVLQEFVGYTLMHWELPFHKALFIVGPTASGKSTFLDVIRDMLGPENIASVNPQQLTDEQYASARLHGAMANIRNDLDESVIESTGMFKEIIGGDRLKAEEKYQPTFSFEPTAKHLYAANRLPAAATDDNAFYRRVLLTSFPDTVPPDQRVNDLSDTLIQEKPGILNWALDGLERLLDRQAFSLQPTPEDTRQTWQAWASPIERFKAEACENADRVPKDVAYASFLKFCEEEGLPLNVNSRQQFSREFAGTDPKIDSYVASIDGESKRAFRGITVKGQWRVDP